MYHFLELTYWLSQHRIVVDCNLSVCFALSGFYTRAAPTRPLQGAVITKRSLAYLFLGSSPTSSAARDMLAARWCWRGSERCRLVLSRIWALLWSNVVRAEIISRSHTPTCPGCW